MTSNKKRWINTRVVWEWNGERYVEREVEGFWYDGPLALAHTNPNADQASFRWRNDDGSETAASWSQNADVNDTVDVSAGNVDRRLRFLVQETAGAEKKNFTGTLEFRINAGAYTTLTGATTGAIFFDSTNLTNNADTTDQLSGTGTFFASGNDGVAEDAIAGGASCDIPANDYTNFEYTIRFVSADLNDGDTVDFRITEANSFTVAHARATIVKDLNQTIAVGLVTETDTARKILVGPKSTTFGDLICAQEEFFSGQDPWVMTFDFPPDNGNLLIWAACGTEGSAGFSFTGPPTGFTELLRTSGTGTQTVIHAYKISDGTETSLSQDLNDGNSGNAVFAEYVWDGSTPTVVEADDLTNQSTNTNTQSSGTITTSGTNIVIAAHFSDSAANNDGGEAVDNSFIADTVFTGQTSAGVKLSRRVNAALTAQGTTHTDTDTGDAMVGSIASFESAGATIAIGQVTETDLAQSITAIVSQTIAVNQVNESDTAQAITFAGALTVAVAQVTETDVAQAVTAGLISTIAINQVTEIDLAQPITVAGVISVVIGQVAEIDLAQPITASQASVVVVGQVNETDISRSITASPGNVNITVAQVNETDIAQAISVVVGNVNVAVAQVVEADAAQPIAVSQATVLPVAQVIETDTAQALTFIGSIGVAVSQVTEIDLAQPITPSLGGQFVAVAQVNEIDTAQSITAVPGNVNVAVAQTIESNIAQSITVVAGAVSVGVAQITETDLAQVVTPAQGNFVSVAQVSEIDTAQPITSVVDAIVAIGQVQETDVAQSISVVAGALVIPIGQVAEIDVAQSIAAELGAVIIPIGQALESDAAQSIAALVDQLVAIGLIAETDLALSIAAISDEAVVPPGRTIIAPSPTRAIIAPSPTRTITAAAPTRTITAEDP